MSFAYDQYLAEHIGNVNKGLHWMLDNLGFKEEKPELEIALVNFDHDESKYSVEEYDAYDKYFYGGNRSYKVVQEFNYAWLHHIHNNPHHWQYWVLLEDDPESGLPYKALEIPVHVIFEMIADWWSFSWKEGNLFEIFNWYADHRSKQIINPKSREIVEYILERIWKVLIMQETVAGHDISEIEKQYRRFWAEQDDVIDKIVELGHPNVLAAQEIESLVKHSDSEPIGKVIGTRETENGLEVTVEYSKDKQEFWKHLIEDGENDIKHSDEEDDEDLYGVPELKKFPMPDKKHVKSAIRFFNYIDPKHEKELADAILEKAKEFGLDFGKDISVGEENRFRKYLSDDHLEHSGRLGQKWGVQNGPPYPLDRETVKKEYGSDAKVMESNKTDDSNGSDKSSESEKKHRTTKVSSVKKELTAQIRELKNEYKKAAADENVDPEYLELLDMEINELKEEADARQRMAKQNHPDEYYTPVSKRLLELEPVEKLEDLKKLDPNANIEKARMNINHPDGDNMIGRDYNCPNCAAAFELTERGYDVIARRKKPGSNVENVEDFFKGGKLQNVGGETEIPPYPEMIEKFSLLPTVKKHQQELNSATRKQFWDSVDVATKEAEANVKQYGEQQGIGARGLFVVGWIEDPKMAKRTTAFHAMNYKVVAGRNGEPEIKIFDTQSRKAYKQNGDVKLKDILYDADPRDVYMMRTDTLELSDKIAQAVYSNRRG